MCFILEADEGKLNDDPNLNVSRNSLKSFNVEVKISPKAETSVAVDNQSQDVKFHEDAENDDQLKSTISAHTKSQTCK